MKRFRTTRADRSENDAKLESMHRQIEIFNHGVPEGSPVTYRKDDGSLIETHTRSKASILSGHTPVIWLEKMAGCVLLDRVTPRRRVEMMQLKILAKYGWPVLPKVQSKLGE